MFILLFYLPFSLLARSLSLYMRTTLKNDTKLYVRWLGRMEKYTKLCQECAISERNIILCVASFYIASFVRYFAMS